MTSLQRAVQICTETNLGIADTDVVEGAIRDLEAILVEPDDLSMGYRERKLFEAVAYDLRLFYRSAGELIAHLGEMQAAGRL